MRAEDKAKRKYTASMNDTSAQRYRESVSASYGYVELIRNVSASVGGFADANVGLDGARRWIVERFPGSFTVEGETDPFDEPGRQLTAEEQAERDAETRLRLRPSAAMPNEGAIASASIR